jgi:predicted dehydrogenase
MRYFNALLRGGTMALRGQGSKQKQKKIRYAVVGLGHLAQVAVLPAFVHAKNSELAALVSGDPAKQKQLGRKYKIKTVGTYEQYEECLREVDAVYIVLPNHMHKDFTVRALNAGVHVLCEKPLAVTEVECKEMIAAAERNQRKLMVAYRLHFEKANLDAIQTGVKGKLGELRFFTSEFAQQVSAGNVRVTESVSNGGGPIYDMGIYCINAARYLLRAEPVEILAASASRSDPRFEKVEEMTAVTMKFPGDRIATFTASFGATDISRYTLVGTKGVLTADPAYEYAGALGLKIDTGKKSTKRNYPKRDQFAAEISYFSDCILQGKDPEPSGEEGVADVRVVEAIYESVRSGKPVTLAPFERKERPGPQQEIHRPSHGKPDTVRAKAPSGEAA